MKQNEVATRSVIGAEGREWTAFADGAVVAHGRPGAVLAFRPADGSGGPVLHSTVTFNSMAAADFALKSMSEKELKRRLSLSRQAVGTL